MKGKNYFPFPFPKGVSASALTFTRSEFRQNMTSALGSVHHDRPILIDEQYVVVTRRHYEKLLAVSALSEQLGKSFQSLCQDKPVSLEKVKKHFHIVFSSSPTSAEKSFFPLAVKDITYIASLASSEQEGNRLITNLLRRISRLTIPSDQAPLPWFHDDDCASLIGADEFMEDDSDSLFRFPSFVTYYTWRGDNVVFYHAKCNQIIIDRILREEDHLLYLFESSNL